jgi:hypothetical protein
MGVIVKQIACKEYIKLSRIFKMAEGCVEDRRSTEYKRLFSISQKILSENSPSST